MSGRCWIQRKPSGSSRHHSSPGGTLTRRGARGTPAAPRASAGAAAHPRARSAGRSRRAAAPGGRAPPSRWGRRGSRGRPPRRSPRRTRPRCVALGGHVPDAAGKLDELPGRRREMADVGRAAALVVHDAHLVALPRRGGASCGRSCGPSSRRATSCGRSSPPAPPARRGASSARRRRAAPGSSDSTYGSRFEPSKT